MHVPVPKVLRSSKYSNRKYNPFLSPPFSAFPKVVVRTGMTMDSATGLRLSRPIPGGPRSVFTEVPPHAESASASSSRMIAVPKQSNNPEPREEIPYLEPLHVERQDSPMDGSYLKDDETPFPIPPVENATWNGNPVLANWSFSPTEHASDVEGNVRHTQEVIDVPMEGISGIGQEDRETQVDSICQIPLYPLYRDAGARLFFVFDRAHTQKTRVWICR